MTDPTRIEHIEMFKADEKTTTPIDDGTGQSAGFDIASPDDLQAALEARSQSWARGEAALDRKPSDPAPSTQEPGMSERLEAAIGKSIKLDIEMMSPEMRDRYRVALGQSPSPETNTVGPITYDEVEEIILSTEPPGLSDRDDQIWTRRMAVALADLFNSRLNPSPETREVGSE